MGQGAPLEALALLLWPVRECIDQLLPWEPHGSPADHLRHRDGVGHNTQVTGCAGADRRHTPFKESDVPVTDVVNREQNNSKIQCDLDVTNSKKVKKYITEKETAPGLRTLGSIRTPLRPLDPIPSIHTRCCVKSGHYYIAPRLAPVMGKWG